MSSEELQSGPPPFKIEATSGVAGGFKQRSILGAIFDFSKAVERMRGYVLIPSRLQDVALPQPDIVACTCGGPDESPTVYDCYQLVRAAQAELERGTPLLAASPVEVSEGEEGGKGRCLLRLCRRDSCLTLQSDRSESEQHLASPHALASECSDSESEQGQATKAGLAVSLSYHMRQLVRLLRRLTALADAVVKSYSGVVGVSAAS